MFVCNYIVSRIFCVIIIVIIIIIIIMIMMIIFWKFKVALIPTYKTFLSFAKSCVLSCLSKVDNIKKFHRAVFELKSLKL